jgi:hypothetical protein
VLWTGPGGHESLSYFFTSKEYSHGLALMPPLPPRGMDAITSIRQLVERNVTLPLQNMKLWSQNSTFKIDALGLVTLLGAEEVNRSIDHLQQRRRYTEYLPLLAAFVVAGNHFTTEQPGFVIYNLTDGITSTELKGWFTRWLMSPTVTTKGLNPAVNRLATATTKSAINCKHVLYKPSLPATLGGRDISAFPDIGAPANFITQRYVHDLGLAINFGTRKSVKTSVGTTINIIGTVKLPFSFEGETESHQLEFNVIQKAVHDVIVGSPFLSLTETFTRHIHRVKQVIRKIHLPRVCYLGSHQYVGGEIDGIYVDAVPDTGADVSVMSSSFAEKHGFMIDTGQEHRVLLEFADGSTATSIGMVDIEWKFGSSEIPYHIDAYVLEELQTDFILDNTFLHGTDAFIAYEEDFWMDDSDSFEDGWMISIIKLVGSVLKHSRWRRSCKFFAIARDMCTTLADIGS